MNKKLLRDYNPDELLLNKDAIKNITTEYIDWYEPDNNRIKYKEITITFSIDILLNLIALLTSFSNMSHFSIILSIILLIVLGIYTSICATRWVENYRKIKGKEKPVLDKMMIQRAKENMSYTAISRITYKKNDEIRYLVGSDYFLPHCKMNKNLTIDDQEANIIQTLKKDFNIKETDIISVKPIDDEVHFSIKPVHDSVKMNAFVFYDISIKEQAKNRLIQENDNRRWVSINKMKKTTDAMSTNKDVIDLLEDFATPKESFVNPFGDIKIIWNITSKCSYNCNICATYTENREELNANDKLKVLNSICSARNYIKSLDFAGGDPLNSSECTTIIQSAIEQLGKDKVSITTTGKGVLESKNDEFLGTVKNCEITIDASHENLSDTIIDNNTICRNEKDYSNNNIEQIKHISEHADMLTINIPIINDDLTDVEIDNLIYKITWLKEHTADIEINASLIRLMPVGKFANTFDKETYKKYNPIEVIKKIKEKLENENISCKLHCSLRVLSCFENDIKTNHCSMLENKLGIDCAGNVFACAWGGYIYNKTPPTKNPFYLGNLTEKSLDKILKGESKTPNFVSITNEIGTKKYRNFCSVVSYYTKKEMFKNYDPLSPESQK